MNSKFYPIPKLENTLTKIKEIYQLSCSPSEYSTFENAIEKALPAIESSHQKFSEAVEGKENWGTELFQRHLLSLRTPIPSSTAVACILKASESSNNQALQASILLHSIASLFVNPKMLQKNAEFETTQQKNMFGTFRIPGKKCDEIINFPKSRHAIILHQNLAYPLEILDLNGKPVNLATIFSQINAILTSSASPNPISICDYSALDRTQWANLREEMRQNATNKSSLKIFQSGIVTLALETSNLDLQNPISAYEILQAGKMRNFDQITNIVVYANAVTGIICEHSAVDGQIICELADALKHSIDAASNLPPDAIEVEAPKPLEFKLESNLTPTISTMEQSIRYFDFEMFPDIVDLLKEHRIYDAWVAMALQLALKHSFGDEFLLTVLPTHVRHFLHGRCDPTYLASQASEDLIHFLQDTNFITLMTESTTSKHGLQLFCKAFEMLKCQIRETKMGAAVGTHIGVIRRALPEAHEELKKMLEVFACPSVVLTGNSELHKFIEFGTGNVYANDQLCVNYLGYQNGVRITLRSSGKFAEKLCKFQESFQQSLKIMQIFAVQFGIIQQMGALEAVKTSESIKSDDECQNFALAIHGGAGEMAAMMPEMAAVVKFALQIAVMVGVEKLKSTKSAIVAVEATVKTLEDCFIFNAGKGAVFNVNGEHELEASIMDGDSGKAGAVACLQNLKNPISAASKVMQECKHVFLAGDSAEEFCADLEKVECQSYFGTHLRKLQWDGIRNRLNANDEEKHPQTVGAVAKDQLGRLASATSTGGMANKMEGRIGDTAVIGAATWADKNCAISCTGDGEAFLRKSIASKVAFKYDGNLGKTCQQIIDQDLDGILAGIVGIDSNGIIVRKTNAKMFFGSYASGKLTTEISGADDDEICDSTKITAPKSWVDPVLHSKVAITDPWYTGVFKLQDTLFHSTIDYFRKQCGYSYVMTPLSTSTISSPMGLGSDSLPVSVNLFGENIYLADSMQFTLEYFLRVQDGIPGTYYVSPSFRGEDPDATHLNQFYHVECEILGDMEKAMKIAENFLINATKVILKEHKDVILASAGTTDHIEKVLQLFISNHGTLPRVTLDDAIAMMPSTDCYALVEEGKPELGQTLKRKGERFLIEKYGGAVWLIEMDHLSTPFYQAYVEGSGKAKAKAADLLIGLGETLGLGERHETAEEVCEALAHHQVPQEEYQWYIDMREVKPLKTSGWGMGTERFLCWLLQHDDIRDIAILPRLKGLKYLP